MAEEEEGRAAIAEVAASFAAVVQGPPDETRIGVYRSLVRRGIMGAVRAQMPRTAAALGARFEATVEAWIDEALPSSPYLRDASAELVGWAATRWTEDPLVPRWIPDLGRYEVARFEVAAANVADAPSGGPLALDRAVRLGGAARVARYAWAVHRLPEDTPGEPQEELTALLLYRDRAHEVRCLVLSPLAAAILERLLGGARLGEAVTTACAALGEPMGDAVLRGTAEVLADLGERGVVLGAVEQGNHDPDTHAAGEQGIVAGERP
ncbi:putative DNA-binding domain-containing protein [Polyangium sp. 6x1]|uniref:HvfC/BufC N-terminal domain-containing protein n=1 Tax=Polyangium sp. 6x1 TaxID=3042689 RepID=UPI0024831D94|nr:putative DNA-binding domain-containing protein [Polyangium sp. 6x1]MDI1444672.1 putative DNA-binding domain-containing protein [Polyangium sp. 6x1]